MTIETSKVRVISNTTNFENEEMNEMIGGEYNVKYSDDHSNTVTIGGNDGWGLD